MTSHKIHKLLKSSILFLMLALCVEARSQNTWSPSASFAAGERERAVSFTIGGRGYVGTGIDSADNCKKDFWEYDPGTNSWTQKADFLGVARRDAVGFAIGSRGYIGTGITTSVAWLGTKKKDFWEYNPITNTWTAKENWPGNFGQGVYYASSFTSNTKGYIVCGKLGPSYYSNELWEYDPVSDNWDQKDNFPGGTRYGGVAVSISGKGYYGCGSDENYYCKDWWEYDPQSENWTKKADFPGAPRFNAAGFTIEGRGFVGLGTDGGYQKDFYEYNPASNSWQQKADYMGSARRSVVAFGIGGFGYVGTGNGFSGIKRTMYRYKPYFLMVPEVGTEERIASTVSPNPVRSTTTISFTAPDGYNEAICHVFDTSGKRVFNSEAPADETFVFNRNGLPAGIYIYEIQLINDNKEMISSTGKIYMQ